MKVDEAIPKLTSCLGIGFDKLFSNLDTDIRRNKGKVGQLLLQKIGLPLDSNLIDFDDGELKTNKSNEFGEAKETMYITQISSQVDTLIKPNPVPFKESYLYTKIRRLIFLPVCKDDPDPNNWYFVSLVDVNLDQQPELRHSLKDDYYNICTQLRHHIENSDDGFIHTSSGNFLQVRTKNGRPYSPIFSQIYGRQVSNKNHAFYFRKQFMAEARKFGEIKT